MHLKPQHLSSETFVVELGAAVQHHVEQAGARRKSELAKEVVVWLESSDQSNSCFLSVGREVFGIVVPGSDAKLSSKEDLSQQTFLNSLLKELLLGLERVGVLKLLHLLEQLLIPHYANSSIVSGLNLY